MIQANKNRFLPRAALQAGAFLGLASIAAYAATGYLALLLVPFAYAYLLLLCINWKQAYWVLLFCLPLSIQFSFAGDTLSLTLPAEPVMWLFLLLALLLFAGKPERIPFRWWFHPVVVIVILQWLWLLPAVAYSETFFLSLKFLLAKIWVLACFFVVPIWIFKTKSDFKKGFLLLFLPILATTLIILVRHAFMGFRFADMNNAVGRLYYNHVEYSTVISIFFPAILTAYSATARNRKGTRLLLGLCILFFLAAVYFSYARAAVLAVVFAVFMSFMVRVRLARYVMPVMYGIVFLFVLYMIPDGNYTSLRPTYEKTIYHKTFSSHISATFRGNDVSSMERLYRWTAALRMSGDKPLTGFGPNAFYDHYRPYALPSFRTYSSSNEEHSTTHNYFLYVLAEQGYPGMLLYALLMAVVFAGAQKTYHRLQDKDYKKWCLTLVMMLAACFVNNFFSELIETPKIGSLFYLCIALLVIIDIKSRQEQPVMV